MQAAAEELQRARRRARSPASVTDPCDGRTQGTTGMMDSLPYRNDAAIVFRRLIRSLPTRRGVLGVATCDKGLPAMMMALAAHARSALRAGARRRDAAAARTARTPARSSRIGARFAHGEITLERGGRAGLPRLRHRRAAAASSSAPRPRRRWSARRSACRCRTRALAPSGQPIWLDMARRSARALVRAGRARHHDARHPDRRGRAQRDGRPRGVRRLDQPAAAHPGDRPRRGPAAPDGRRLDRDQPPASRGWSTRCPTARATIPTVRVFLAGGVPEVMLHLRRAGPARARRA